MKVYELIEKLGYLNPEKDVFATVEFQNLSHIVFAVDRIDISTGTIRLIIRTG